MALALLVASSIGEGRDERLSNSIFNIAWPVDVAWLIGVT
jgi:hypothetical protein